MYLSVAVLPTHGQGVSPLDIFAQVVWFVVAFAFVVALTVLFTRWIAGARYKRASTGNLHVVESIAVGQQVYLQLVRAGGKYIVLGVTRGNVSFVCELDESEVRLPDHKVMGDGLVPERFEKYLRAFMQKKPDGEDCTGDKPQMKE